MQLQLVKETFIHLAPGLVEVKVENAIIRSTAEHPFWVEDCGWTGAGSLAVGDEIRTLAGFSQSVQSVRVLSEPVLVYNFEVSNTHSYYVSEATLLVHNSSRLDLSKEVLSRMGVSRESAQRLARKSAEAEQHIGIHGVSTSAGRAEGAASTATRGAVESKFPVHNTPARNDPLHRTEELPKPVTPEVTKEFNQIFGRETKP